MKKQLSILIFTIFILISCTSKVEKEVYFSVNSQYCTDCELIVNNQKLGKLKVTDLDKFEDENHLANSNLLHITLEVGAHDIIVVNENDTINYITWTLKSDGKWKNKTNGANLTLNNYSFGATIKNVEDAVIIEMTN